MIETNELEEGNTENEEENPFSSGFGGIHSDTDELADIDSNAEEQTIFAKENAKMRQECYDTKQETADITGKAII